MLDWDWEKNNAEDLNPNFLTCGSHTIAHWKGHNCGHEWQTSIKNRSKGKGCPVCSGRKIVEGINDFGSKMPIKNTLDILYIGCVLYLHF